MIIEQQINQLIRAFSGHVGYIAKSLSSDDVFSFNSQTQFPVASCIKIPIVIELLYKNIMGELSLAEKIPILSKDQVPGTGVLKDLSSGLELRYSDLAKLSITISDNTAANKLIDKLGVDSINARIKSLGMKNTHLGTKFVFTDPTKNLGSPADFCQLLENLSEGSILNKNSCEWLLNVMECQQYVDYIPRHLPFNRFAKEFDQPQDLKIANKVGMLSGVINDMAIINNQDIKYILVIFTKNCDDLTFGPDNEGAVLISQISKLIFDFINYRNFD